jgi:hypothetical protein
MTCISLWHLGTSSYVGHKELDGQHQEHCKSTPTQKQVKDFLEELCQKNLETIKIKQEPVETSDKTTDSRLPFKGASFKLELVNSQTCERSQTKAELTFCHLGSNFMKPSDYHKVSLSKVLHFT